MVDLYLFHRVYFQRDYFIFLKSITAYFQQQVIIFAIATSLFILFLLILFI